MASNRSCSMYLGCHIAERVLSKLFTDVEWMPCNHPGYDFITSTGLKIDVKASCKRKDGTWSFGIRRNVAADFFLCIAFDDRNSLTPLYLWLIPGKDVNSKVAISIRSNRMCKWDGYSLDMYDLVNQCDYIVNTEYTIPR